MEGKVLGTIIESREAYEEIADVASTDDFSDHGAILFQHFKEFYEADPDAKHIDLDVIKSTLERKYPKHADTLLRAVQNVKGQSAVNIIKEFTELKLHNIKIELGHAFLSEQDTDLPVLLEQYDRLKDGDLFSEQSDNVYIAPDVEELLNPFQPENLLPLYPKVLNDRTDGGLPRPGHILIFATPEQGKTAFAINMSCGFMNKGFKVLYIGNEEGPATMLLRFISRLSGLPRRDIMKDAQEARQRAIDRGLENLVFISSAGDTISDIERYIKIHEPDVLVVDQMHNLEVPKSDGVQKLDFLAGNIRRISNAYNLIAVSLTQAADSAKGKPILDMGDVYFSNTAVQGHVDLMLGLGSTEEMHMQNKRNISICKNKITGDHTPCSVTIDPYLSKLDSV